MCLVGDRLLGLVLCHSVSMAPGEDCRKSLLLNACASGLEGRIWNMLLGKVRVFVGIVAVIMGLSGRGGSALKSNSDLYVSDIFHIYLYGCLHDAVLVYTVKYRYTSQNRMLINIRHLQSQSRYLRHGQFAHFSSKWTPSASSVVFLLVSSPDSPVITPFTAHLACSQLKLTSSSWPSISKS